MIVDCFTFFNELDVLELRLSVLEGVVDRFVLCEAPYTFRGRPKALVYAENRARFARWSDRITHLVYDVPPDANPWHNEWGQRAFLTTGVHALTDDDVILIGDVDEIPLPANAGYRAPDRRVAGHRQLLATGYFNRVNDAPWIGTRSLTRAALGDRTLHDVRQLPQSELAIVDGGWHFTSLGGPEVASAKMHAYAHAEFDIPYRTDERRLRAEYAYAAGVRRIAFDETFPPALHDERWSAFVWNAPADTLSSSDAAVLIHAHGCFATVPAGARSVGALVGAHAELWKRAGRERFGDAFAGVGSSAEALRASLAPGDWVVIDELACAGAGDLRALAAHGSNLVAYAVNARSFASLDAVLDGRPFPAPNPRGVPESEAAIVAGGYRIERRDDVFTPAIFAPLALIQQPELIGAGVGRIHFERVAREAFGAFTAHGFLFVCNPDE